jgi:hypothetical protein
MHGTAERNIARMGTIVLNNVHISQSQAFILLSTWFSVNYDAS